MCVCWTACRVNSATTYGVVAPSFLPARLRYTFAAPLRAFVVPSLHLRCTSNSIVTDELILFDPTERGNQFDDSSRSVIRHVVAAFYMLWT